MNKRLEKETEIKLTNLMFKAISSSGELKNFLKKMKREGKITNKSVLTFSLRPSVIIEEEKTKFTREALEGPPPDENFNSESWLKKLRLKMPF